MPLLPRLQKGTFPWILLISSACTLIPLIDYKDSPFLEDHICLVAFPKSLDTNTQDLWAYGSHTGKLSDTGSWAEGEDWALSLCLRKGKTEGRWKETTPDLPGPILAPPSGQGNSCLHRGGQSEVWLQSHTVSLRSPSPPGCGTQRNGSFALHHTVLST